MYLRILTSPWFSSKRSGSTPLVVNKEQSRAAIGHGKADDQLRVHSPRTIRLLPSSNQALPIRTPLFARAAHAIYLTGRAGKILSVTSHVRIHQRGMTAQAPHCGHNR